MEVKINAILSSFKQDPQYLIPVLQKIQEELGYLPDLGMEMSADYLKMSRSRVFAVATFYAQFRFTPIGKKHILVCKGTACHVKGAPALIQEIEAHLDLKEGETSKDMEYTFESVACIGACGLAPCMMINKKVEANLTAKKIKKLLPKGEKK